MSFRTCIHVKVNGVQCQSPALRNSVRCYFHHQHRRMRRDAIDLSALDSCDARLKALNKILSAMVDHRIDADVARTLVYGIHCAQTLS
jgi:hypothetical protein